MGSDLIDSEESQVAPTNLPALPVIGPSGGAPMTSNSADVSRNLIDIPKPEFAAVSVHTPRTPANMLTLDRQPLAARASLNGESRPDIPVVQDSIPSLPPDSPAADSSAAAPANAEIASGPKVSPAVPSETIAPAALTEPGIPLLHGTSRLSDFYAALHQPLLDHATVDNTTLPAQSVPTSAPEEAELPPPPPPAETAFGSPAPQ